MAQRPDAGRRRLIICALGHPQICEEGSLIAVSSQLKAKNNVTAHQFLKNAHLPEIQNAGWHLFLYGGYLSKKEIICTIKAASRESRPTAATGAKPELGKTKGVPKRELENEDAINVNLVTSKS
ncbi:MAG: hypothetical protein ABSA09_05550 [Desulfobaccales bacterium]